MSATVTTIPTKELVEVRELREALDLDVRRVLAQTKAIQEVVKHVMIQDVHYGVIEGTDKPTLYQPGADKLCVLFRLRPRYRTKIVVERDFISVISVCRLYHIETGLEWGEGHGWANSREDKYVNQSVIRRCPECKKQTVFRSKKPERDGSRGWFCWANKGGCGLNFAEKDPGIVDQGAPVLGDKVHNLANTLLKISNKRSKSAAVLTATGAADVFGQDLEDLDEAERWLDGQHGATNGNGAHPPANGTTNGNGASPPANGAASPAANGAHAQNGAAPPNGNGNGNGSRRATPLHIRELTSALRSKGIAAEPERQLAWINGMQPKERQVKVFTDLLADDATSLTARANAGEVPGGAEK